MLSIVVLTSNPKISPLCQYYTFLVRTVGKQIRWLDFTLNKLL